jgi:hypothetical protein
MRGCAPNQAAALERMERALVRAGGRGAPRLGGLTTLAELLALMQRRRQRWYTAVPRLGPKGAPRITDWLNLHARSLHCVLSPLATTPPRQLPMGHPVLTRPAVSADVAPLESLRVPPELNGSQSLNRAPVPAHEAELATDLNAVNTWIAIRGARSAKPSGCCCGQSSCGANRCRRSMRWAVASTSTVF